MNALKTSPSAFSSRVPCAARPQVQRQCCAAAKAQSAQTIAETVGKACTAATLSFLLTTGGASARPEPVNRPDLLPSGPVQVVLDPANFLTRAEEAKATTQIKALEADTGIKLRLLAQNYPDTPGLAIKDYWGVDGDTVVLVADPTFGDILNFNVGTNVELQVPPSFWSRLSGKYGNKFYQRDNGREASIMNAVSAINTCLREPPGRLQCSQIQGDFGEEASAGKVETSFKSLFNRNK